MFTIECNIDIPATFSTVRTAITTEAGYRVYVDELLARANGNVSAAARLGQMTRSHLNELLAKRKG